MQSIVHLPHPHTSIDAMVAATGVEPIDDQIARSATLRNRTNTR